jgi:transcription antitermination factor NusG
MQWVALWTHSHCEQVVYDQLAAKGFEAFLPTIRTWSRRAGAQRLIPLPMFPGYLFVHHAIDKHSYIEIVKSKGLVRILGARWDHLSTIPEAEIGALQKVLSADVPVMPHAYLREGQRVRISKGPLTGLEGILVRSRPSRGLLVLSVERLHQSVAVEVDCTAVVAVGTTNSTESAARVSAA